MIELIYTYHIKKKNTKKVYLFILFYTNKFLLIPDISYFKDIATQLPATYLCFYQSQF